MGKTEKRSSPQKGNGQLWFYWIVGAGLWIWTLSALFSGTTGAGSLLSYLFKERESRQTLARIEVRIKVLETRTEALRSDPFAMERQAREREHRVRPGEILVLPSEEKEQGH